MAYVAIVMLAPLVERIIGGILFLGIGLRVATYSFDYLTDRPEDSDEENTHPIRRGLDWIISLIFILIFDGLLLFVMALLLFGGSYAAYRGEIS